MTDIFISYRHEDSKAYAGRIFDRMKRRFGAEHVFMDVSAIRAGLDFVEAIDKALARCDACIVVIGKQWLTIVDEHGRRRLDDPEDFVRLEVAAALSRGTSVVPVLVDEARMPDADALPDSLKKLARIQALALSDRRWDSDVDQLVHALSGAEEGTNYKGPQPTSYAVAATTISILTALLFGVLMTVALTVWVPEPIEEAFSETLLPALGFGVSMGLIFGFFVRGDAVTVSFTSRDKFDAAIHTAMSEFGFRPLTDSGDLLSFKRGIGRIFVTVGEKTATIVGPALIVLKLKARFV